MYFTEQNVKDDYEFYQGIPLRDQEIVLNIASQEDRERIENEQSKKVNKSIEQRIEDCVGGET